MGIDRAKDGKLLYHLTFLDNLDSIIEENLLSRRVLNQKSSKFIDAANQEIICKREQLGLDCYIPFHFHPYSAFDVAVKNKFSGDDFIYLCISRVVARKNKFKILPIHPLSAEDKIFLYDYDEGIEKIDWETLMTVGRDDTYTKHVKMAECLTEHRIPIENFHCIYVKSSNVKEIVEKKLRVASVNFPPPYVYIQDCWF